MNRRPGSRKPAGKRHEYRDSGHGYCSECGLIEANFRHDPDQKEPKTDAQPMLKRRDLDG